ncbi:MAG: hypothetical protein ACR2JM_03625 [Mycobacterium sp.]
MSKKLAGTFLTALAMGAVAASIAPAAHAEVCGDVGGRYVNVGGCSHVGADIADAAIVGAAVDHPYYPAAIPPPPPIGWPPLPPGYLPYPSFPGEAPCYTPEGQQYWTPGAEPCF